jgi:hypothetical protein
VKPTPRPDIKTDKMVLISGAAFVPIERPMLLADGAPVWATLVPTADDAQPHQLQHFRILHQMAVGTVDELLDLLRRQMERAFHTFALTVPPDQDPLVIPTFGEASLRRQNEAVAELVPEPNGVALPAADPKHLAALRPSSCAFSPHDRDYLMRLVAAWDDRDTCNHLNRPTRSPAKIDALIDALTALKGEQP